MYVDLLEEKKAVRLFMFHAFGVEKKMKPNFDIITSEIVKACGELPLSIEVMDQFLSTKVFFTNLERGFTMIASC